MTDSAFASLLVVVLVASGCDDTAAPTSPTVRYQTEVDALSDSVCPCLASLGSDEPCDPASLGFVPLDDCTADVLDRHAAEARPTLDCWVSVVGGLRDCFADECSDAASLRACALDAQSLGECPELPASVTDAMADCE